MNAAQFRSMMKVGSVADIKAACDNGIIADLTREQGQFDVLIAAVYEEEVPPENLRAFLTFSGLDINMKGKARWTALSLLCDRLFANEMEKLSKILVLLDLGADPTIMNGSSERPIYHLLVTGASVKMFDVVLREFIKKGFNIDSFVCYSMDILSVIIRKTRINMRRKQVFSSYEVAVPYIKILVDNHINTVQAIGELEVKVRDLLSYRRIIASEKEAIKTIATLIGAKKIESMFGGVGPGVSIFDVVDQGQTGLIKNFQGDVNEVKDGETALHYLIRRSLEKKIINMTFSNLFSTLLKKKADPNIQNKEGMTPLHIAARENLFLAINDLLEIAFKRINPLIKDYKFRATALHFLAGYASSSRYIAYLFRKWGDHINDPDGKGRTPLDWARELKNTSMEKGLEELGAESAFEGYYVTFESATTPPPLTDEHRKIFMGLLPKNNLNEIAKFIQDHPGIVNYQNDAGQTPILQVSVWKEVKINTLALLFEHGANPNIADRQGLLPTGLILSCRENLQWKINRLTLYLANGADPDTATQIHIPLSIRLMRWKSDPMNLKSVDDAISILELIFTYGGDVNLRDESGASLAMILVTQTAIVNDPTRRDLSMRRIGELTEMLGFLKKSGANMNCKDSRGLSLVDHIYGRINQASSGGNYVADAVKFNVFDLGEVLGISYWDWVHPFNAIEDGCRFAIEFLPRERIKNERCEGRNLLCHAAYKYGESLGIINGWQQAIVKVLITYKADINEPDRSGRTPVFYFCLFRAYQILDYIQQLHLQMDLYAQDVRGVAPVHLLARSMTNPTAFRAYIETNGDKKQLSITDRSGRSAYDWAVEGKNTKIAEVLQDIYGVESAFENYIIYEAAGDRQVRETFIDLLKTNNLDQIRDFVKANPTVINMVDSRGRTPVLEVSFKKSVNHETVSLMFELGADPNIHDKEGLEPIRDIFAYATDVEWKIERMRLYLEAGAAPDSASRHGETVAIWLMNWRIWKIKDVEQAVRILRLLFKHGGDVNQRNAARNSLVHVFVTNECLYSNRRGFSFDQLNDFVTMLSFLVKDQGADKNVTDNEGKKLYEKVFEYLDELITNRIGKGEFFTKSSTWMMLIKLIETTLEKDYWKEWLDPYQAIMRRDYYGTEACLVNSNINLKKDGDNLLHFAIHQYYDQQSHHPFDRNATKVIMALIDRGVDVNEKDRQGRTPVFYFCLYYAFELLDFIQDRGIKMDLCAQDILGIAPIHQLAKNLISRESFDKYLIPNKVDLSIMDRKGRTPLDYAIEFGNSDIVELLRDDYDAESSFESLSYITYKGKSIPE